MFSITENALEALESVLKEEDRKTEESGASPSSFLLSFVQRVGGGRSKFKFKTRLLCRTTCIIARRLRNFRCYPGALLYVPDAHTVDSGFQNSSFERDHVDTTTAAAENRVEEDTLHSATYAQVGHVVAESRLQL